MRSSLVSSLVVLSSLATEVLGQGTLTAALDYGTFQGAYSETYNISYWMKVRLFKPPNIVTKV